MSKKANTQVTWALLTETAAQARVESHRLRHFMDRATKLVEKSEAKDHLYMVAGDIIQAAPRRLDAIDACLDRLNYALAVMGKEHLRDRLSMDDRALVDDAAHKSTSLIAARVAHRYLVKADKNPALGFPGGPCHVMQRIHLEVKNPKLREELIEDIERGLKMENRDAAQVYDLEVERGPNKRFSKMMILPHAQYRMDQRGVTVPEIRLFFANFTKAWGDAKSRQDFMWKKWEEDMARGEPIRWTDPKTKLTVVWVKQGQDAVRVVTTYWEGQPDPKPKPEESCQVR